MASVGNDPNGRRRVLFQFNGKRRTVRLGKCSKKEAQSFAGRIERLVSCLTTGTAPDGELSSWLAALPDETHTKLARLGLVDNRQTGPSTLGELIEAFYDAVDVKDSTLKRKRQTGRKLLEHFGSDVRPESIGVRDAEQWRASIAETYSKATVSKDVQIARQIFGTAIRWEWLTRNPFSAVKAGSQRNAERAYYVTPEETAALLDACPDHDWRCIVALARWGGLRMPSETLRVRWEDVDWAAGRLRVRSPKTEHHEGKGERVLPLFPELRAVLLPAFEAAPDGAEYVVGRYRGDYKNLHVQAVGLIRRAGLTPWPRLFNSMRASRATELAAEYPPAACEAWMGHSTSVAVAHYHMVRDEDYARAASNPTNVAHTAAQRPPATSSTTPQTEWAERPSRGQERGSAGRCEPAQVAGAVPVRLVNPQPAIPEHTPR